MGPSYNDSDLRFRASLEDQLTPQLEALQKRLQQMGATPAEIKMFLRAYDEATPKIKEAQKQLSMMPKEHILKFRADTSATDQAISGIKQGAKEPIYLNFVDNLKETSDKLFNLRSKIPLPVGGLLGSNQLYGYGAAAVGAGGLAAIGGVLQQSVSVNSTMEQSLVTLNQTLKDSTQAQQEMRSLVQFAKKTPFNYQDVLQADVRLRSYGIPTMPGDPGFSPSAIGPNGQKMKNQGWLRAAGEMSAAMGTPITQGVEAIADARQGYFMRMQSFGLHMDKSDFQTGGRYQGMTYEQGLSKAIERFSGSMDMQSKTFQGVMSNVHDIIQQTVIRPVGQAAFQFLEKGANSFQNMMNSDSFQTKASQTMETIQHKFVEFFMLVNKGKQYFMDNLEQPLINFGKEVVKIAAVFGGSFGKVFIQVFSEVAKVLGAVIQPMVKFVSEHENLIKIYALLKALDILGFKAPITGLRDMQSAINPLHPSISQLVKGMHELVGGAIKVGIAAIVAGFINAAQAAHKLKDVMQQKGLSSELKDANAELSKMAAGLDASTTKMKQLAAYAIQHQGKVRGSVEDRVGVGVYQAEVAQGLQQKYGINANTANELISKQNITSKGDVDKAALSLRELKAATDALHMSFKDALRIMTQFSSQAGPIGLGGIKGAPYLAAMVGTLNKVPLTAAQNNQGIYNGDDLFTSLAQAYHAPSVDQMKKLGTHDRLNRLFNFGGTAGPRDSGALNNGLRAFGKSGAQIGLTEIQDVIAGFQGVDTGYNIQNQRINEVVRKHGGMPITIPSYNTLGLSKTTPDLNSITGATTGLSAAQNVNKAMQDNEKNIATLNRKITEYQNGVTSATTDVNTWSQAQQQVGFQMEKLQHQISLMQRPIEDLSLKIQQYTLAALTPLERQMQALQQRAAEMGNSMNNAQYSMSRFTDGLLDGEQATINQLHALDMYNKQLELLQLRYQTIGSDLGQNIYDGGFSIRVKPMAMFTLAYEQQKLQRKMQMEQLKSDINYGDKHWQIDQAARPLNQRREMSFEDRMKGIKQYRGTIDELTIAQHEMGNKQFELQSRIYGVTQKLADMNQQLQGMQNRVTDKELHGGLRHLQDEQYAFGRKVEFANLHLQTQNTLLSNAQQTILQYRNVHDGLAKVWGALWNNQKPEEAMRALIGFGAATGLLSKDQTARLKSMLADVQNRANEEKRKDPHAITDQNLPDIIKRSIVGALTGDLWRNVGDQLKKSLPGPLGTVAGSLPASGLMTAMTLALTGATIIPALTHVVRQFAVRGGLASIVKFAGKEDLGKGTAERLLRGEQGLKDLGMLLHLDKIPGLGKHVLSGPNKDLVDIAKGGAGYKFAEFMGGGKFMDGIEESFKFIRRMRTMFGGAAGAAVGTALFGPVGGLIGGFAGSRFMRGRTTRQDLQDTKEIAKALAHPAESARKAGEEINKKLGHNVEKIGKEAEKIKLRGTGRFAQAVKDFGIAAASLAALSKGWDTFKHWLRDRFGGGPKGPGPGAPPRGPKDGPHDGGGMHDSGTGPSSPHGGGGGSEVSRSSSLTSRILGRFGRVGRLGAMGATLGYGASNLLGATHGDPGSLAYMLLSTGRVAGGAGLAYKASELGARELLRHSAARAAGKSVEEIAARRVARFAAGRTLGAVAGVAGGAITAPLDAYFAYDFINSMNPNQEARHYPNLEAKRIVNRGATTGGYGGAPYLAYYRQQHGHGNISAPEAHLLVQNQLQQGTLSDKLAFDKLSPTQYKKYLAQLKLLQDQQDTMMKVATGSAADSAQAMITSANAVVKNLTKKRYDELALVNQIGQKGDMDQLKQYLLDNENNHKSTYDNIRQFAKDHYDKLATVDKTGQSSIYDQADKWLTKLHTMLDKHARALGVTVGDASATTPGSSGGSGGAFHDSGVANNAANGAWTGRWIKGKGDGKGHIARVGEEGDELIVPLSPHRRDRAKSLLKHAQSMIGYANGGIPRSQVSLKGVHPGVLTLAEAVEKQFPNLVITSGTGGRHANGSLHYMGDAVDIGGDPATMNRAAAWILRSGLFRKLAEGIHNPNLSVKNGQVVPASFWGSSTWAEHANHIHLGFTGGAMGPIANLVGRAIASGAGNVGHLPHLPQHLKHMGVTGVMAYKALAHVRNQIRAVAASAMGPGDASAHFPGGGNAKKARQWIAKAMALTGVGGSGWLNTLMNQAFHESTYNPNSVNTWDVNAAAGDPSKGLLQVTGTNFKKFALPGHRNIFNPVDNAIAAIRYIISNYGHGNATRGLEFMVRNAGRAYAQGAHNIGEDQVAQLHEGEMVLKRSVAKKVRSELAGSSHASDLSQKAEAAILDIQDKIAKSEKHLKELNDKTGKKNEADHLSSLNDDLRKRFGVAHAQSNKASGLLKNALINMGDKSGGENTLAGVDHEKKVLKLDIADALDKLHNSPAYKAAVKAVKTAEKTLEKWTSQAHSAHSQGGKKVTKNEQHALNLQKEVIKAAHAVVTQMDKIAKVHATGTYLKDAAKRGVNEKLVEAAGVSKKELAAKFRVGHDKHAHSIKDLYTKAAKDTPGSKAQSRDLARLQSALKQYSAQQVKKLEQLRKSYTADSKKAQSAALKAGLITKKAVDAHSHRSAKSSGSHAKAAIAAVHAHSAQAADLAGKTHEHLKGVKSHIKTEGEKGRTVTESVHKETKEGTKTAKSSDDKRSKAEIEADKREKEYYKNSMSMLQKLVDKDLSVSVTNHISGDNVKADSTVTKVKKR